jgi:cytochrome b561
MREPNPAPAVTPLASYTPLAKALHWLIAALLVAQFTVAWTMPHIGRNTVPETLINLHFSLGVLIIALIFVRLAWRMTHAEPPALDGIAPWQHRSARAIHGLLYALLIALPLLGWINASWRGFDVSVFGLFNMPRLVATRAPAWGWTGDVHVWVSEYGLLTLVGLHVLAALYHQFMRKEAVLARMLPAGWMRAR